MLTLNIISTETSNRQIVLDDLKKRDILAYMAQVASDRDHYVLALSEEIPEIEVYAPKDMITTAEWLDEQGLDLTLSDRQKFAYWVSRYYREKYGEAPRTIFRPNDQGRFIVKANGFKPNQTAIFRKALKHIDLSEYEEYSPDVD